MTETIQAMLENVQTAYDAKCAEIESAKKLLAEREFELKDLRRQIGVLSDKLREKDSLLHTWKELTKKMDEVVS